MQNAKLNFFMPSGKTHDTITIILAVPAFAVGYAVSRDIGLAAVIASGFLFGGLMFGPDLDTASTQYSRWRIFRFLWLPYRMFFKHRSRWSHGLTFGALLRVVYFTGALTLASFLSVSIYAAATAGEVPQIQHFTSAWHDIGKLVGDHFGAYSFLWIFAGTWLGAASHTVTDITVTYIKTGRTGEVL